MGVKYSLKIHLIFVVKYRKKLLINIDIKSILLDISKEKYYNIEVMEQDKDHIHMIITFTPTVSISMIVRDLKQSSTNRLWNIYNNYLETQFWRKKTFWSDGYFVSTVGEVSSETVKKYIREQG